MSDDAPTTTAASVDGADVTRLYPPAMQPTAIIHGHIIIPAQIYERCGGTA